MHHKDQWLEQLYIEAFPQVAKAIKHLGGDLHTAKDLFHDALILYLEKRKDPSFAIQVSEKAYLAGIARILWIRKYKDEHQYKSVSLPESIYTIPEDFYEEPETSLYNYLKTAGQKCLQLLQAFYYERLSMQDIRQRFNYGSIRSATVQKYKCIEKVREQVKQMSHEEITA